MPDEIPPNDPNTPPPGATPLFAANEKLTKINRGRAYYASPYNLAEFLFTDYIRNRKKFLH